MSLFLNLKHGRPILFKAFDGNDYEVEKAVTKPLLQNDSGRRLHEFLSHIQAQCPCILSI